MHIVVGHGWQSQDDVVAKTIADTLGSVVYEARQKIAGGGPAVLASFADAQQAETLAGKLSQGGVPALVIDVEAVRRRNQPFQVRRFELGEQALRLESFAGESCDIDYSSIELLLVATCNSGQSQITEEAQRKFSIGKTLLAGGVPMTKEVKSAKTITIEERDETLWLYTTGKSTVVFDRGAMNYDGLGDAMQFTRDLNFTHFKNELRRLAPQANYDDRLLKRAVLVRVLGAAFNPESDLDIAFEILSLSLREKPA